MKKRIKLISIILLVAVIFWGSALLSKDNREPYQMLLEGITMCAQVIVPTFDSDEKGQFDYVIVIISIIIVVYTLTYSLIHLIRPKEKEVSHIKNQILEDHEQ